MTSEPTPPSATSDTGAPTTVSQILRACGITKVVWIDDDFHVGVMSTPEIIERVKRNYLGDGALPPPIAKMKASQPDDDALFGQVARQLEEDGDFAKEVSLFLTEVGREPGDGELSPAIREKLINDLGSECEFRSYSYRQWLGVYESLIREEVGVLYLVDNNYYREEMGGEMGRQIIIKQLLSEAASHRPHCVLFTKSAAVEGDATPESSDGKTFLVLAKKNFKDRLSSELFSGAIRRILNHLYVLDIAEKTHSECIKGLNDGLDKLKSLGIHALEGLFFERPDIEGASEIEAVNRLWAMISQRSSVDPHILQLANTVRAIRRLDSGSKFSDPADIDPFVKELGERQFFIPGDFINGQCCQIANGDIFEDKAAGPEDDKLGILLWQPCDLALRRDGGRGAEIAWYIPFKYTERKSDAAESRIDKLRSGKVFYLEMGKFSLGLIEFRLDKARMINLTLCDLVSTNKNGNMSFTSGHQSDEHALPGEVKRYKKVLRELDTKASKSGNVKSVWADSERKPIIDKDATPWTLDCKIARIKRLREPYAQEVLRAMCAMISRPGFEYTLGDVPPKSDAAVSQTESQG